MTSRAPTGSALLVIGPSLSQMSTYHKDSLTQREREKILDTYEYQRWSESEHEGEGGEPVAGYVPGVRAEEVAAAVHRKRCREDSGRSSSREASRRRADSRRASREVSARRSADSGGASREGSRRRKEEEDTGKAGRSEMSAIVAKAVTEGVSQGIQAAAAAAKASAPPPALPPAPALLPASSSSATLGALSSVGAAGDDVLVPRALLRELVDHCNRLEQSARHAGRLSAGFAQACEQETRVFADIRSQLEARGLLRF